MHLNRILPDHRGALALAILLTLTLAAPATQAGPTSLPPAYPDRAHVSNGCHLSTITYLARYLSEHPTEQGEPLVIQVVNFDGTVRSHTIALLSWQGQLWCRDEYFGVFTLGCAVEARPSAERLVAKAQEMLERHEKKLIRAGGITLCPVPPEKMSAEQRTMEVKVMAEIIPFPTTVYWVHSGKRDIPLAFFRPAAGQIAVYDPQHGTCLAECSVRNDAKIVAAIATKLGYQADHIRPDFTVAHGRLVAANLPHSGGVQ